MSSLLFILMISYKPPSSELTSFFVNEWYRDTGSTSLTFVTHDKMLEHDNIGGHAPSVLEPHVNFDLTEGMFILYKLLQAKLSSSEGGAKTFEQHYVKWYLWHFNNKWLRNPELWAMILNVETLIMNMIATTNRGIYHWKSWKLEVMSYS